MNEMDLFKEVVKEYNKTFVNSIVQCKYGCFGKDTLYLDFYLARKENELSNGYLANDCYKICFKLKIKDNDQFDLENMEKSIRVKPKNSYMYCDSVAIPFRKVSGNSEKIIKTLSKFFIKLKDITLENYDNNNLLDKDRVLVKDILKRG